jgi:hypothetical protein
VFSQFTSFLAMVRLRLDQQQQPYLYLDGSVPVRLHQTKRNLADAMLEGTNESHKLTSKELLLRNIFRLSKKSLYLCTRSIKSSRLWVDSPTELD